MTSRFYGMLILLWAPVTSGVELKVKKRAYRALKDRIGADLVQWTDSWWIALPKSDPVEGKNPACGFYIFVFEKIIKDATR